MKVKPLGDRMLVKEASTEEITKSGIVLPDTVEKNQSSIYQIVELGNGPAVQSLGLKIGDKILSGKYSGEEVEMKEDRDTKYKILYVGKEKDDSDILAIIE